TIRPRATGGKLQCKRINRQFDPASHGPEDEQVSGIGVYGNMALRAFENITFRSRRDFPHGKGLAAVKSFARFWVRVGTDSHSDGTTSIQCLYDPAAQLAEIIISYHDGIL